MASTPVVKSVSKKLKYYFEVKRLEDGFDLSGPNQPILDHPPLRARPTLQYDGLHDRPLKHYFHDPEVRQTLTQFRTESGLSGKEKKVKKRMEQYMRRYRFVFNTIPAEYYISTKQGPKLRDEVTPFGMPLPRKRRPFKGGTLLLRSAPPRNLSRGEAHRLVNAATKLVVATDTVDLSDQQDRQDKRGRNKQDDEHLPKIGPPSTNDNYKWDRTKVGKHRRKFYVYDQDGRRHLVKVRDKDEDRDSAYSPTPESSAMYLTIEGEEADDDQVPRWLKHQMTKTGAEDENKWVRPQSAYASDQPSQETKSEASDVDTKPRPHSAVPIKRPHSAKRRGEESRSTTPSDLSLDSKAERVSLEDNYTQTSKELLENYDKLDTLIKDGKKSDYRVHVFTGERLGSATKADIKLVLHGDNGRTPDIPLKESKNHKIKFQKGQEDIFDVRDYYVGPVRKITIGHTRTELGYGWYVEKVIVHDLAHAMTYVVPCKKWLSSREDDGKTIRQFYVELSADYVHQEEKERDDDVIDENLKIISYENATESSPRTLSRAAHTGSHTSLDTNPSEPKSYVEESSDSSDTEPLEKRDVTRLGTFKDESGTKSHVLITPEPAKVIHKEEVAVTRLGSYKVTGQDSRLAAARKDDFFDQQPARKDYSFVSDSLSQTTDQDNKSDFESDKPLYSARGKENKLQHLKEESEDADKESSSGNVVVTKAEVEPPRDPTPEPAMSSTAHKDQEFMDGFKAGLEAAHKAETEGKKEPPLSETEGEASEDEAEERILQGPSIHQAAKAGNLERIKDLVKHSGALRDSTDERGQTALHIAAAQGHLNTVKWLTAEGANLEAETPTGYSPMHVAAISGHTSCMMVLGAMGASVNCKSIDHQTPLHLAAMSGHLETVKWLVANRADLDVADNLGRIALDLAQEYQRPEVASFLKAAEEEQNKEGSVYSQLRRPSRSSGRETDRSTTTATSGTYTSDSSTDSSTEVSTARKSDDGGWRDDVEPGKSDSENQDDEEIDRSDFATKKRNDQLMEKKKLYEEQHQRMEKEGTSFLDSIRAEYSQGKEETV